MNIRNIVLPLLCAASGLAFSATPDGTSELRSVTVAAPALRTDIRNACPAIDAQLQKLFSSAWGHVHQAATIPVRFRIEGSRVADVRPSMASMDYRPYVRTAVSKLDCAVASGEAQDFKFLLVITEPDDRRPAAAFALAQQEDR
jgi:hypothetical protein